MKNRQTHILIDQLLAILKNNDTALWDSVLTLDFKLRQFEEDYEMANVTKKQLQTNKKIINDITCQVIEEVKNKGFYLVTTPENNSQLPIQKPKKIKILFASANPVDAAQLRLDREAREIEYELLKSKNRDQFELIKLGAMRIEDLQFALLNHSPEFLHFSGHGNCDGIALLNNEDKTVLVKSKPLSDLFKLFASEISCVFLNSCHSIKQSEEISKYIKKVVCMNSSVPDEVAIRFAITFYQSLAAGRNIDFSFEFAKIAIAMNNLPGSDIPLLLPVQVGQA